jgi:hypothetical protein
MLQEIFKLNGPLFVNKNLFSINTKEFIPHLNTLPMEAPKATRGKGEGVWFFLVISLVCIRHRRFLPCLILEKLFRKYPYYIIPIKHPGSPCFSAGL